MRHITNFLRHAASAPLVVVQAILTAVYALLRAICGLFGIRSPAPPQLPMPGATPTSARDQVRDSFEAAVTRDLQPTSDVGMAVHRYASSKSWGRIDIDLTGLSPAQFAWLVKLTDADLEKLAAAGPKACERAVTGKRCGIVGLPLPQSHQEPKPEIDPRDRIRDMMRERTYENGRRQCVAAA